MPVLLVIDDDVLTLDCFSYLFPRDALTVLTTTSPTEGLQLYAERRPDVVVLDIKLPGLSGLEAFRRLHAIDAKVPIILITGHGTADTAIEAMRLGAYEYIVKPPDPVVLREVINQALQISRLMRVPAKVAKAGVEEEAADMLVGNCAAMQEVYKAIGRVAPQDVTVLIQGESGTGKELVARAIYHYSPRHDRHFLAVNCAAIPETLLESELFGHEKGAFTGADRKRIGKLEQCDGGTLFLDEIGDMTPLLQAKVLRALQEKQFERVGGNAVVKTDVRVIAATNRDLEAMIATGRFRSDLYYRLKVCTIQLPPLRERGDDVALLAEHFLQRFSRELGRDLQSISSEAHHLLQRYAWPGNVRELQSVLKQAILQAKGPVLLPEFLNLPATAVGGPRSDGRERQHAGAVGSAQNAEFPDLERYIIERLEANPANLYADFLAATERQLFAQVLRQFDSNLTRAATVLGISRATLRARLSALGMAIERFTSLRDE